MEALGLETELGGGGGGEVGENENIDPDGRASRRSFLWLDPASGEAPFTFPHPIKVAHGRGTFFSQFAFGAGRPDWF